MHQATRSPNTDSPPSPREKGILGGPHVRHKRLGALAFAHRRREYKIKETDCGHLEGPKCTEFLACITAGQTPEGTGTKGWQQEDLWELTQVSPATSIMKGMDGLEGLGLRSVNSTRWTRWSPALHPSPFPTAPSFTVDEGDLPGRQGEESRTAA